MQKLILILFIIGIFLSCQKDEKEYEAYDYKAVCSSIVYDELYNQHQSVLFYPDEDTIYFNPDFQGYDSIKFAVNCLNIYDPTCWRIYKGDDIMLVNRSKEPNDWADGPFSLFVSTDKEELANIIPSAKRNNLNKFNVIRFQLYKDTSHYEQVYHIGVGIKKPTNDIVMIDYEKLEDMIGPEGNYGIGEGYNVKCKVLNRRVIAGANYLLQSSKNPEYRWSGMTRCRVEKPVLFTVYKSDQELEVQRHLGCSLSCGSSAHFPLKGLQVVARSAYGENDFNAKLFEEEEDFKNVRIRMGGSGQFARPCNQVMDAIGHDLYDERGLKNQFISLYMNGFQWGIGYLQEKLDENYIEKHYGFDSEFVDILEVLGMSDGALVCNDSAFYRKLDKKGRLDSLGYNELVSFANNYCWLATVKDGNGIAFTAFYNEAINGNFERLDELSLFDYIAQVDFIMSHDPGRSSFFFCSDRRDPKWFVQGFDFDRSFNDDPGSDYWDVIMNINLHDPLREIARRYFEQSTAREAFIIRYQDLLNTKYSLDVILPKINRRINEFALEVDAHEYAWTPNSLEASVWKNQCYNQSMLENFVINRHQAVSQYLADRFMTEKGYKLQNQHTVTIKYPKLNLGAEFNIKLNTLELRGDFKGEYYPWPALKLSVENLPNNYELIGWKGLPDQTTASMNHLLVEDVVLAPIIRKK